MSFSFDDQLETSLTASMDHAPDGKCPTQASFLKQLPSLELREEEIKKRSELDPADPRRSCAICREGFGVGDGLRRLPCGHEFHGDCVVPWLQVHNTCPVCRWRLPQASE